MADEGADANFIFDQGWTIVAPVCSFSGAGDVGVLAKDYGVSVMYGIGSPLEKSSSGVLSIE